MTLSKSIESYANIREVMDRALAAEKGIRITRTSPGQAVHFKQKCHAFRALDRKEQIGIIGKPISPYDCLVVSTIGSDVFITKAEEIQVEEL